MFYKIKVFLFFSFCLILVHMDTFAQSDKTAKADDVNSTFKSLEKIPDGFSIIAPSIKFDPEYNHVAYTAYQGKNHKIIRLDDTTLPGTYHAIQPGFPIFSPDGKRIVYIAYSGNMGEYASVFINGDRGPVFENADQFTFSKDGSRYAYRAMKDKKQCVVVDGVQGQYYDGIPIANNFQFSPDSKHFSYVGLKGKKCVIIRDGTEESLNFEFIKDVSYSPDSSHLAYKARLAKKGNVEKWQVVYDGIAGDIFDQIFDLTFSSNSKHFAFTAIKNRAMVMIVDGKEIVEKPRIGIPVFSADSENFAYAYVNKNDWYIVLNDREIGPYAEVRKFFFSYDSKRYAFVAKTGDKWFLVIDGKQEKTGFKEGIGAVKFSLDSSRYVYAGINENLGNIVVDGKPGPDYISAGEAYFNPDSTHVVYRAKRKSDGNWETILDGTVKSKPYNAIAEFVFSYDSRHLAYNAAINLSKSVLIVDGKELHAENNFKIISDPQFSPDSKHVIYYVRAGKNGWQIAVDGKILPEAYAGFMRGTPFVFDTPTRCHILGFRMPGPEFVRIEVDLQNLPEISTSIEQDMF